MRHELSVNSTLAATHSLSEREGAHPHLWKIQICVAGLLERGRILSLPEMKRWLDEILAPLQNRHLNGHPALDTDSAAEPTCENLSRYLFDKMSAAVNEAADLQRRSVQVVWVQVAVIENDGIELGNVRFYP